MTSAQELLLFAAALYLFECLLIVPPDALLLTARGLTRLRVRRAADLAAVANRALHLQMPLPPLGLTFLSEQWPLAIAPAGVQPLPSGRFTDLAAFARRNLPPIAFDAMKSIAASGLNVRINDTLAAKCATPRSAAALAALLQQARDAKPADRPAVLAAGLRARFDWRTARQRAERATTIARPSRIAGSIFFVYLFAIVPLIVWLFGFERTWRLLLIPAPAMWLACVALFRRAHRRLFPQEKAQRRDKTVTMLLMPLAAIRAVDPLTHDALAEYHPAALARVLCTADDCRAFLRELLCDVVFSPLPTSADFAELSTSADPAQAASTELSTSADPAQAASTELSTSADPAQAASTAATSIIAHHRAALRQHLEKLAADSGLNPAALLAPPQRDDPACLCYCPRCLTQYVIDHRECPACPGVTPRAFDAAARAGAATA